MYIDIPIALLIDDNKQSFCATYMGNFASSMLVRPAGTPNLKGANAGVDTGDDAASSVLEAEVISSGIFEAVVTVETDESLLLRVGKKEN